VRAVGAQPGSVVLAHAVHDGGMAQRGPQVGVIGLVRLGRRWGPVPGLRVGVDDPVGRLLSLAEEPPVPPGADELLVGGARDVRLPGGRPSRQAV
jgi:hypothetical protein